MRQTTIEAWLEWKARCALARCGDASKQTLMSWAAPIFRRAIAKLNPNHPLARPPDESFVGLDPAWSWMEVHFVVGKMAEGKRPKDHAFLAASAAPNDERRRIVLESYFATVAINEARRLILRDRQERSEADRAKREGINVVSLHAPVHGGHGAPTFEQLYSGAENEGVAPESMAESQAFDTVADSEAKAWFTRMEFREKLALGGHLSGRSLADPEICRLAGCGKSQMYASLPKAISSLHELKSNLAERYGEENDALHLERLRRRTLSALARFCIELLPPEKDGEADS